MDEFDLEEPTTDEFDLEQRTSDSVVPIEQTTEQPEEIRGLNTDISAPIAGYAAGKAAEKGIEKAGTVARKITDWAAERGGTSPEQLKLIREDFKTFSQTKPMNEVNKLLATTRETNAEINRLYDEAEKLLIDKKITPDEYKSIVERAALQQDKYGRPTFARPISQSEISKTLEPSIVSTQEIVKNKQQKLLDEFADLKAKEAVAKATEEALGVLPEDTAAQITKTTKEQVLKNPQAFDFKGMTAQEVLPIYEQERGRLIKAKETPLAEIFPSLKGTSIDPSEAEVFRRILKIPETADISGDKLQEYMRKARERAFLDDGKLSDKPSAAFGAEVRKEIAKMSPEAGKLMEAENVEINKLDALENAGYIKREGSGINTTVTMDQAQRTKLIEDLSKAYPNKPTQVIEDLEVLGKYLSPEELKKLNFDAIKLAELKGGDISYINANPINQALQSMTVRKVSRAVATAPEAIATRFPKLATAGKMAVKALPITGALIGGVAAQAAEEALSPEPSGALPTEVETEDRRNAPIPVNQQELDRIKSTYWFEKGYTPEEQLQKARLASFKEGLPAQGRVDEMPSAYEKPKIRQRKEQVMAAKKAGALAPTYVEAPKTQVLKADNPLEIASVVQALQTGTDKASQEYSRVLSQIVNASPREKESILFGLNQQPEFRRLVRKAKGEENIED